MAGEADTHCLKRRAQCAGVGARAFEAGGERRTDLIVKASRCRRRQAVRRRDAGAPDDGDAAAGGQGAAALHRDDLGTRFDRFAVIFGLALAGLTQQFAGSIVAARAGDQFVAGLVGQHVERHCLANAFDAARRVGGDAGGRCLGVQREQEDRILV
ncbi:hypothetical protein [Glacieibacterium sp.]|uniref:hypothetical protein n=1 Tax=Glacieibacterium sp. TaxID=2860237 RepID=UPI003B00416E